MFPGSNPREWRRSSPHPPLAFTSSSPGAFEAASAETVARCPSFVTFWDDTVEGWPRAMVERPSTEIRLELIEARLRAQEVALHWLFKAISSIDPGSGRAVLLAPESSSLSSSSSPERKTRRCDVCAVSASKWRSCGCSDGTPFNHEPSVAHRRRRLHGDLVFPDHRRPVPHRRLLPEQRRGNAVLP